MGQIYKIINNINSKIYVGKTIYTAEKRYKSHLQQLDDGTAIHNAMKKYGVENFSFVILEDNIENKEELSKKEIYWIKTLNSLVPNGYNIAQGGEGGNGTHARNLMKWREDNPDKAKENIQKLNDWVKNNKDLVKEANKKGSLSRKEKYGKDITKKANEASKKKVRCVETGIVYDSVKEAAISLGYANGSHIGQVCNNKRKMACNYHWQWV